MSKITSIDGLPVVDAVRPLTIVVQPRDISRATTGASEYKKNYLGLSDNMTYIAEQLEESPASIYRYRVTFNPTTLIPDITLAK